MLPQAPAVVKYRHCEECYWLCEAEGIGEVDGWIGEDQRVDPAWTAAERVEESTDVLAGTLRPIPDDVPERS